MRDPYVYPETGVLINKFNIQDQELLEQLELLFLTQALEANIPIGNFSYSHLKNLHKHLFGELYAWAGETRTVNIAKPSGMFCAYGFIDKEITKLLGQLSKENYLCNINNFSEFIKKFTYFFAEVNAIHPFREGNGRTTRIFFEQLASLNGYELDFSKTTRESYLQACISSHNDDNSLLESLLSYLISVDKNSMI